MRRILFLALLVAAPALAQEKCMQPRVFIPNPFDKTHACEVGSSLACAASDADKAMLEKAAAGCVEHFGEDKPCIIGLVRYPSGQYQVVCGPKEKAL